MKVDGASFWARLEATVAKDTDGALVCRVVLSDITERGQAEIELRRLAEAVRQTSEAIVITTTDGTIEYANPAFGKIAGYALEELIGRNPRMLKSGHQGQAFYKQPWDTIIEGRRWTGRITDKRKDGTIYTAECFISPVKDGGGAIVNLI